MNNCKDKKIIKTSPTDWHKLTRIKISVIAICGKEIIKLLYTSSLVSHSQIGIT